MQAVRVVGSLVGPLVGALVVGVVVCIVVLFVVFGFWVSTMEHINLPLLILSV